MRNPNMQWALKLNHLWVPTASRVEVVSCRRMHLPKQGSHRQLQTSVRSLDNRSLAQKLKSSLKGDELAYRNLKRLTAQFRSGDISARTLQQSFVKTLGSDEETREILTSIADLIGPGQQQQSLLAVAEEIGFNDFASWQRADIDDSLSDSLVEKVDQQLMASGTKRQKTEPTKADQGKSNSSSGKGSKAANEQETQAKALRGQGVLLWLKMDLRIHDQPALNAAAKRAEKLGSSLSFCFINSPDQDGDELDQGTSWRPGAASLVWQMQALKALDRDLQQKYGAGAAIIYKHGPYLKALKEIADALNVGVIYYSKRHEPGMRQADESVATELTGEKGIEVQAVNTTLLHEPEDVQIATNGRWVGHFGTLMPFLRACEKVGKQGKPLPAPQKLPVAKQSPISIAGGVAIEDIGMVDLPKNKKGDLIRWDQSILEAWDISESAAKNRLEEFAAEDLMKYEGDRSKADGSAVSRLSPYVHFGQVSAREVLDVVGKHGGKSASKTFWRRLVWRDLAYWQLHHWPDMSTKPIRAFYEGQEWREDAKALKAWQKGRTGFPMVDAGMRQLWATGWMQQSVRMICAAFLTEYLNIHWVHGCRWFHDTLVDADLAINSMMWQNAGKCGLDQWNFTLLPSSSSQGSVYRLLQDPTGSYVRQWVPEVSKLPKKFLHQPWLAPADVQKKAGLDLGTSYPHRITGDDDLKGLRKKNETAIKKQRKKVEGEWTDNAGYDLILVPEGATTSKDGQKMKVFTKRPYRDLSAVKL